MKQAMNVGSGGEDALRFGWAKNNYGGGPGSGSHVHGSTVCGKNFSGKGEDGHGLSEGGFSGEIDAVRRQ